MNLEDLFDKYIEEPARKRKKIPLNTRLLYSDTADPLMKYVLVGLSVPIILLVLWVTGVIQPETMLLDTGWITLTAFYYMFDKRTCKKCNQKMLRLRDEETLYYFCDTCKQKIEIRVKLGGGA